MVDLGQRLRAHRRFSRRGPSLGVISTSDLVLPGARGHVVVPWIGRIDPHAYCVREVCSQIPPSRFTDPSELPRFDPGHRIVPVPRRGSGSPWSSVLIARGLGEADREGSASLRKRGHSRARLGHGLIHGVTCQGRLPLLAEGPRKARRPRTPGRHGRHRAFVARFWNHRKRSPAGTTRGSPGFTAINFAPVAPAHRREDAHGLSPATTITTAHRRPRPARMLAMRSGAACDGLCSGSCFAGVYFTDGHRPGWCGMRYTPSAAVRRVSHP